MKHEKSILSLFNGFAGKTITQDQDNPLVRDIEKLAADFNLTARIHFPGMMSDAMMDTTRVNIYTKDDGRGGYTIQNRFDFG